MLLCMTTAGLCCFLHETFSLLFGCQWLEKLCSHSHEHLALITLCLRNSMRARRRFLPTCTNLISTTAGQAEAGLAEEHVSVTRITRGLRDIKLVSILLPTVKTAAKSLSLLHIYANSKTWREAESARILSLALWPESQIPGQKRSPRERVYTIISGTEPPQEALTHVTLHGWIDFSDEP